MSTNRDWIRQTLAHDEPEAVPYYFDFTPPAKETIETYYGAPIEEHLQFPLRLKGLKTIKPLYADPDEFGETAQDEFGVVWSTSRIDRGVPVRPCLPSPDLSTYIFPDSNAEYRFDDLEQWCEQNAKNFTIIWVGDLWERAAFMRGMENMLMDLTLYPDFVEELLENITGYILGTMEILLDRYTFDGIAVSDDYGSQSAMLMSPDAWRKYIQPNLARIYESAKRHDKVIMHHSDGYIIPIIGDLIEIGCDILHPVQPEAMDILHLKRKFGKNITFWGGMRTQDLLVSGTPDAIREEVKKLKLNLGNGGGFIMSNGITVQSDVPLENMVAMIEEARKSD